MFRAAGASRPQEWAASQLEEGINLLHRYLFLREAWRRVLSEGGEAWIDNEVQRSRKDPAGAFAGIGSAIERFQATGANAGDLTTLVRGMQARLLFDLCHLPGEPSINESALSHVGWALVETNDDQKPTHTAIGGLHESVLQTDPTGREMRPRRREG